MLLKTLLMLEKMENFSKQHANVFVVDNIYETMEEFDRSLLRIEKDGHPTVLANTITAQLIYEKLINSRLISVTEDGQK